MAQELDNCLRQRRQQQQMNQAELAEKAGLSRQSVIALEQGASAPSAAVALKLAQALGCRVEELFWLAQGGARLTARWHASRPAAVGERLKLAWVGAGWHAFPLAADDPLAQRTAADGVVVAQAGPDEVIVTAADHPDHLRRDLLLVGCDPSLGLLAAHTARRYGDVRATWLDAPSGRALELLAGAAVHAAGAHLWDAETQTFNRSAVQRAMPGVRVQLVRVANWQLGWLTRRGNPKSIRGAADLARPEVTLINRPASAGAHHLLHRLLAQAGVPSAQVRGFGSWAPGHLGVAQTVAMGGADVGIATLAVARAFGLAFEPLETEEFDLAVPLELAQDPRLQRLLDTLVSRSFLDELAAIGGYETQRAGATALV